MTAKTAPVTLVRRRVLALRRHLPTALDGDPGALHRARVASRRLRELLPLVRPTSPKARRRIRRLTQLLGRVRELDVAIGLLNEGDLGRGVTRLALYEARQHLREGREARRVQMLRRLHKVSLKKLDRHVEGMITAAAAQEAAEWRRVLATRLTRRAARLRDEMASAGAIYVAERLHGVRIAAKKLRYALEIGAEMGLREAAGLAAIVRRSQVTLGDLQDRSVLLREVHEAGDKAVDESARLGLLALAAQLEEVCRERHAQYLAQRPALADAVAAVRQHIVPELARGARTRAPLRAALKPARAPRRAAAR
ncbi:MAG TPA: CHAD domain-containing protein [Vicinamibacterales bacterium]|nr:CHAD domain-containing protein [Vicinamibacterales bacterium]